MNRTRPVLLRPLVLLAMIVSLAAPALQASTRIGVVRTDEAGTLALQVLGQWQSGCPPLLRDVQVSGRDITLVAQPDSRRCAGNPGSYRLSAELPPSVRSSGGVHRLRYLLQDDPVAAPRLMAFELLVLEEQVPVAPESGFWWGEAGGEFDHAGPGIGAQLERQGGMLAVTFTGYEIDGSPAWMFGAAALIDATTDVSLTRLQGGRGPFGGYRGPDQAETAGRLQIEWLSSSRAVFWFSRESARGLELRPISMVRFDFGQQPGGGWLGRWAVEHGGTGDLQVIEFIHMEVSDAGFVLFGKGGESLSCVKSPARPSSPPDACELQFADGRIWTLEDVGLSQLRGRDADLAEVRAFPLPK